jgi:hypothetical protein
MIDQITIVTKPAGIFTSSHRRYFKRGSVIVRKNIASHQTSCSACEWYPNDEIELESGEIIKGQIVEGGYYDE